MKHARPYLGLAAGAFTALGFFAMSSPGTAIAQGPFDDIQAFITNDTENPVPVVDVGRQPYQSTFGVFTDSISTDCDLVEIPDGMTLTVNTVGVSAETDGADIPNTFLIVGRQFGGLSSGFRYSGELHPAGTSGTAMVYEGIYNLNAFAGPTEQGGSYRVNICVGPISGGATFNSARGIVTGYLEPGVIFDGRALP